MDDDARRATRSARWAPRWHGWARWELRPGILVLAALAVVIDLASAWTDVTLGAIGGIAVSPALAPAVLLAGWIGFGALGCSRRGWAAWREYAVGLGLVIGLAGVAATTAASFGETAGILVAVTGEELVYRVALLLLVGAAAAAAVGRDWRDPTRWGTGPGVTALVIGGLVFSALPGHVVQMQGAATVVPFASLAIVLGWVVLRTGAVWPAIGAHAVLDLAALGVLGGAVPAGVRVAVAGAALLGLVVAADVAGRRMGLLRPVPTVIDLTATAHEAGCEVARRGARVREPVRPQV